MKTNQLLNTTYEQVNFMPEWERVVKALPEQTKAVLWDPDDPETIEIVCAQEITVPDAVTLFNNIRPDEIQIEGATATLNWF